MKLEKEQQQMRPKVSRKRDIIKIRAEINTVGKNKTIVKKSMSSQEKKENLLT